MEVPEFPRPLLLLKEVLSIALAERNKTMHIGSKNPETLPARWIRIDSHGGPQFLSEWDVQIVVRYMDKDESLADANSGLIHGILMAAAGVRVTLPDTGPADFPWIIRTQHVSGPVSLNDEDLPEVAVYQSAVRWVLHCIP